MINLMGVVFALLLENRFSVHSVQVKGANLVCALVLKALQSTCWPLWSTSAPLMKILTFQ